MIIQRLFSVDKNKKREEKKEIDSDKLKLGAIGTGAGSVAVLANVKPGRLTGKVVRYHNTKIENVPDIMEHGIKASYAEDPKNLTNRVLRDVDMEKKKGLVYTAKKRMDANGIGATRALYERGGFMPGTEDYIEMLRPTKSKTLKLEFDYDDIKNQPRIENPELRGARTPAEFRKKSGGKFDPRTDKQVKTQFKVLGENTHIFKGDIDPSHIKGSKYFKKRTMKDVGRYIKNNPMRFAKEAGKVGVGIGLGVGSAVLAKKAYDQKKREKEEKANQEGE